ncbi:Glyoxylase, beta-lactamase superfamily II [Tistlia consotensis]|uniref:Glyoxylase, beta-lactamase superfamily II n=1 Tax=Tistlia consotensis USBA 355 TaxID=560819 RepID=A0A1Y6CK16_9PROT|nr:N-acyl homoserine lactonase family protein [Tistlia consotensis]SMF58660.1 Glyoxylase, beta-lactamase superfamily II [Tistlia consotensis USBA 355]SNR63548.1 Glyoxylase, beta-lactamase superfamily II [Tistlia consotensis]
MKMHVLSGGRLRMKKFIYFPAADREETVELPVSCLLLRHAQGNVLFDTGCHPSVCSDPEARWGKLARAMVPLMDETDTLPAGLASLGLSPDDIDVVVNSHFHPDHCGCNGYFRKATVVVHEKELAAARAPEAAAAGYFPQDWDQPMPLEAIAGQRDLFGDGRLVLLPLPGHTAGLIGALATLERSGTFLLASDAVPFRENLDREIIPKNTWSADQLARTFDEIRRLEAGGATVLCGHDEAQWRSLRKGPEAYD